MKMSILAAALVLLAASASAAPILEETIDKTYAIDPTAKFSIRNDDGSIFIYGADTKEIKIQAIKKAYNQKRLDEIAVNISVAPGEVSIDTKYPPKPKWGLSDRSGAVDYVIVLPWTCDIVRCDLANGELLIDGMRGGEAHASLGNGRLFGHNCFTDLHISVANGGLDVAYDWWEEHKFLLDAEIANGNAHAFIPADASFHLLSETTNGHVFSDFTEQAQRQPGGVQKIDMSVGDGAAIELKLRAINGSIKISEINL